MKANEINLNRFLSQSETQFVIPVYQRNYDWTTNQCQQLLHDIIEVGTNDQMNAHFIGSIVYVHDDVYQASGTRELIIIDGQQRLTTLTLLYISIFSLAGKQGKGPLQEKINETYLINKFSTEAGKLKLRPTENNDLALKFLLRDDPNEVFQGYSRLIENYDFFQKKVTGEQLEIILKGLSKLMFVEISLDRDKDDPQRIFESLNSTGLELSQADLIRNYILMRLNHKTQKRIYENYWEIIENHAKIQNTNSNRVSDFVRDYLTLKNKKIPNKSKVYSEFKSKYPISSIQMLEENLNDLKRYVKHYNKILNPQNEPNLTIRKQLQYINQLAVNVAYPFLLQIYDDYANEIIDKDQFCYILELIQSFAWRRFIVGLPTNALNKIFMTLYSDIDPNNYTESLELALLRKRASQRFPNNTEVKHILKEKDVYGIKSKNRLYFLDRLENYNNKERVSIVENSSITIEHIFPKNPTAAWKDDLDDSNYKRLQENYLNTIGNLTLSGNNGSLSNKSFIEKRDMNTDNQEQGYRYSRLWLNRHLAGINKWDLKELEIRFELIWERFQLIWIYPELPAVQEIENEINIFNIASTKYKKIDYVIFFDQKLVFHTITELYIHVVNTLFELQPETFFTKGILDRLKISKDATLMQRSAPLNDTYSIETKSDNDSKFGKLKYLLKEFDLEDELYIKWN